MQIGNGTSGSLSSSSALILGGGTFSLLGKTSGFTAQTLASLSLTAGTASSIVLNANGGSGTTLTLTSATITTGAGASVNFNYGTAVGATNGSTIGNDIVAWNPTLTSGIIGPGYTVTDSGGTGYATVISGKVLRLTTGTALPQTGGVSTSNYFVNSSFSTSSTTTDGSLVEALSGNVAANTITVDTTGLASGANLALGANTLTLTTGGGMTFSGANPYTITSTGAGGLTTSASGGSTTFNNYNSGTVTISAPILANGTNTVTFNGTGVTILSGSNTYGATTINGGVLQIGAGGTTGTLGSGAVTDKSIHLVFNRTDTYGGTVSNLISGTGSLTLAGTGTLTLSGLSTYTGNVTINQGTLVASSAAQFNVLATASALGNPSTAGRTVTINSGGTLKFGSGNLLGGPQTGKQPALALVIAGGTVVGFSGDMNTAWFSHAQWRHAHDQQWV